ncbi:hypothetical protein K488DRAFT_70450 [Vararia minispora EC-137]|uniref:Uncharacterized protein n=1 Tax=Vararia minispora EC-137 TaxID=1314806 RepID=A0ACB8QM16_9AGAM|nr:hypothetical protein K488DRAFT_70450 [Vararia minispora EC-137]
MFNPMVAVDISCEFDIPIILPAALYLSSRLSMPEILGYPLSGGGSGGARDDVLLFPEALQKHLRRDVFSSAWFPIVNDCPSDVDNTSYCPGFSGDNTLKLAAHYLEPSADIFAGVNDFPYFGPGDPCEDCIIQRYKIDRDAYQPLLWSLLPVLCPRKGWVGWMNVKEAQTKATVPWDTPS